VQYAGVEASQNRPQVLDLRGARWCLVLPDVCAKSVLPYRTASLYFSRSGRNDYVAGPALAPSGVTCSYPQGVEHDGSIYVAFTGEYPDDWRNIVGVKVDPSPDPDRFYVWPRHRELGPHVRSQAPDLVDLDGRRCVRFGGTGSAGVDIMPLDLAEGDRLEVRLDVKVQSAHAIGENVLLSFGDTRPDGTKPIRVGGPSLAGGRLSISTDTKWSEAADFSLDTWHRLAVDFAASHFTVQVDDQAPRRFQRPVNELNPRLYLGEGVIVGDVDASRGFEFAVGLASLRTIVRVASDE
jgi:hypothetical protein